MRNYLRARIWVSCLILILIAVTLRLSYYPLIQEKENIVVGRLVVIYLTERAEFTEPVLRSFESNSKAKVQRVYFQTDEELVEKLMSEQPNPQADMVWVSDSNLLRQIQILGLLKSHYSTGGEDISLAFKDSQSRWQGIAGRPWVIVYNNTLVTEWNAPKSFFDLGNERWKGTAVYPDITVRPMSSYVTGVSFIIGQQGFEAFINKVNENNQLMVRDSGDVIFNIETGKRIWGIADLEKVAQAGKFNKKISWIYPDQTLLSPSDDHGAMFIVSGIAMLKNQKRVACAKALYTYILSPDRTRYIEKSGVARFSLHTMPAPDTRQIRRINVMDVNYEKTGR